MIIGISGKIGSGKDLTGKIIQYLTTPFNEGTTLEEFYKQEWKAKRSAWQIKKFADKLKECVSIITGIPRADLEKEYVKNSDLSNDWCTVKFKASNGEYYHFGTLDEIPTHNKYGYDVEKLTVRKLLQRFGTEVGRQIHSNFWGNALFSDYKGYYSPLQDTVDNAKDAETFGKIKYPNWIITDVRFPNELEAVKKRDGIVIRINRPFANPNDHNIQLVGQHISETALDEAKFDYTIDNNGTIEELIEKVKEILIKEKIL